LNTCKAVELALVDVPAGFDSIPEHSRTCAIHQGLPRHLDLAARAAQNVAQDLAENVSPRYLLWLATSGGTGLSRHGDRDRSTDNDWLKTPILSCLIRLESARTRHRQEPTSWTASVWMTQRAARFCFWPARGSTERRTAASRSRRTAQP